MSLVNFERWTERKTEISDPDLCRENKGTF